MAKRVHKYTSTIAVIKQNTNMLLLVIFVMVSVGLIHFSQSKIINNVRDMVASGSVYTLNIINQPQYVINVIGARIHNFWAVYDENDQLRRVNNELQAYRQKYLDLQAVNQSLAAMNHYKPPAPTNNFTQKNFISARIIGNSPNLAQSTWIIDAGRNQGIREKSVAISPQGIVGIIHKVGGNSAQIQRLNDPNSYIPIVIAHKKLRAILHGNNSNLADILYIDGTDIPAVGDEVLSSASAGIFPPNSPIGIIQSVDNNVYKVQISAEIDQPQFVRIEYYDTKLD